ncbi:MAG: hypothetical protein Q9M40_10690 [Sulfurimonas sp.]|nr:hypothetical protein [Sulfurimonas sp.]
MKNSIIKAALIVSIGATASYALSAQWLDDGNVVHTTQTQSTITSRSTSTTQANQVTLATGETVTITGGVYVKSTNPDAVVLWATQSGYEAKKDRYIKGAVHIQTPANESIAVANAVAQLEGVTTAAPKYARALIAK